MSAIDKKFESKNFKGWKNLDLKNLPVDGKRYNSYEFMQKEWEYMWQKIWLLLGREEEIPNLGIVQMEDEETGELMLVNTSSKRVRLNYGKYYSEKVNYYKDSFSKAGAGTIDCRVDESYVKKLLGYFKRRG